MNIGIRGFLGTIKDMVLRGFNIGPLPYYTMSINGSITARELFSAKCNSRPLINVTSEINNILSAQSNAKPD